MRAHFVAAADAAQTCGDSIDGEVLADGISQGVVAG